MQTRLSHGAGVLLATFLTATLSGCVTAQPESSLRPDIQTLSRMSVQQAEAGLNEALRRMHRYWYEDPMRDLRVTRDEFHFFDKGGSANLLSLTPFPYATTRRVVYATTPYVNVMGPVNGGLYFVQTRVAEGFKMNLPWQSRSDAEQFANSLNRMIYETSPERRANEAAAQEDFRQKAQAWRSATVKPPMPEDARRQMLLAEDAYRSKKFDHALEYYEKALAIFPLWPEGQFNAALIAGELESYAVAAQHLRCYLELVPDAPDAQAAKDKLFVWEEKSRR